MKSQGLARLGRDAEIRYTQGGTAVANLALAFNYGRKDDSGQQPTQWVQATLWGKRAESLVPYLTKGTAIVAYMSETHIEEFQKRDGTTGISLSARIDDLELVPGQRKNGQQQPAQRPQQQPQGDPGFDDDLDDRIPF